MQNLIKQEQFEIEVLDRLNSARLLNMLVFSGGSMLRLCYGLNRFSVDLDFWFIKRVDFSKFFNKCKDSLKEYYTIKDEANKYYTILFEIKSKKYPRSLKIEIRKDIKNIKYEEAIAYSKYSNIQVLVKTVNLNDMMNFKVKAFLERAEIRDCFDIEFLLKRGIKLDVSLDTLQKILKKIDSLSKRDYTVKLGSILDESERSYYNENNFKILKLDILSKLSTIGKIGDGAKLY